MTTAQAIETSVTATNSPFLNYTHPDDHTSQTTDTPGFKPFTMLRSCGRQSERLANNLIPAQNRSPPVKLPGVELRMRRRLAHALSPWPCLSEIFMKRT